MNSYLGLVFRYLKNNKQRTIFTMTGIIITVFLVFGVFTFGYSLWDYTLYVFKQGVGDYELDGEANAAQIEQLKQHVNVKNVCAEQYGRQYGSIDGMEANTAEALFIYERAYMEPENNCLGYQVSEGRIPENGKEFVVDTGVKSIYPGLKIGETYTFPLVDDSDESQDEVKKEEYEKYGISVLEDGSYVRKMKLVGYFEDESYYGGTDILLLTKSEGDDRNYPLHISLHNTDNLAQSAKEISEKYGISCKPDEEVEIYMGQGESAESALFHTIVAIIAAVFAFFSIYIVRNTMMIAVVERIQDYGILRCIGTSGKQLFYMLFLEGIIMAAVSIVPGMALSYGTLRLFSDNFLGNNPDMLPGLQIGIYPKAVLFTALLTLFAILYSLIEPGRQAIFISPVEALRRDVVLRNAKGKTKEKIKRRKKSIWGVFFGIEGDYAYKNVMRSRGKFLSMIAGFSLSIFLFVIMSTAVHSAEDTLDRSIMGEIREFSTIVKDSGDYDAEKLEKDIEEISQIPGVLDVGKELRKEYNYAWDEQMKIKDAQDTYVSQLGYDREHMEGLKKYVIEGEIDYDALQDNGIVLFDTMRAKDENGMSVDKRKTDLHVGDTISFLTWEEELKIGTLDQEEVERYRAETEYLDEIDPMEEGVDIAALAQERDELKRKSDMRLIEAAKENGYDIGDWKEPEEYAGDRRGVLGKIQQIAFAQGKVNTYTIQAIVSTDCFNSGHPWVEPAEHYQVMMTEECFEKAELTDEKRLKNLYPKYYEKRSQVNGDSVWNIGLNTKKNADLTELKEYFKKHPEYEYHDGGYNMLLQELKVYRAVALGIIICIVVITALQMCNTIYSNMLLRKKEFFLYSVVGMSRRRISKMVMLEGFFAAIISAVIGNIMAVGLSWYVIAVLLNQDGTIIYHKPVGSCLFATAFVIFLSLGITAFCKKDNGKGDVR